MNELRASGGIWDGKRSIDELRLGDRFEPAEPWVLDDDADPEFPSYVDVARDLSVQTYEGTIISLTCGATSRRGVEGANVVGLDVDAAASNLSVTFVPDPDAPDFIWLAPELGLDVTTAGDGIVRLVGIADWDLVPDDE